MFSFTRTLAGALLATCTLAGCTAPDPLAQLQAGAARGHNLLVVTLDTTRADHLGAYGYRKAATPEIDRLARQGLRFDHAMSAAPVTLPSHSTLFTGQYPTAHGVRLNAEYRLDGEQSTLAELFTAAGYDTAAFVSAFVLDARYGLDQGFARYDDRVEAPQGPGFAGHTLERPAAATTEAFLDWLGRREKAKPFFAWVHYFDAHAPYAAPAEFAAKFPESAYDAELAAVDHALGRALAALEQQGQLAKTVVVVAGDHGESLGEHGEATHGIFLYDAVMRVPLILACPALWQPGVVDDRVVSLADLTPTLRTLFALNDGAPRQGLDWVGAKADPRRAVYLEGLTSSLDFGWAPLHALRRHQLKRISAPRPELYDLRDDPGELRDRHAEATGELAAAEGELARELEAFLGSAGSAPAASPIPEETRESLTALGYLAGAGPAKGAALEDPKDMIGVSNLLIEANAHLAAGRPDQALRAARQAVAASPADRSALQVLGKVYLRLNKLPEAEEALRRFTAIQPKADVTLLLAQIALFDGREDEATLLLDAAGALEPFHGGVFIARGDLALRRGDPEKARFLYLEAAKVDPYRASGVSRSRLAALPQGK